MQRALVIAGFLAVALAGGATAQSPRSIDPGMTRAQVVERLGQPAAVRSSGGSTYLFYKNGCVRACGIDDVVILEGDGVVDAIFRSSERQYTGQSSSPRAVSATEAAHARRTVVQAGAPDTAAAATPVPPADTAATRPPAVEAPVPSPVPSPVPVARPNMAPSRPADVTPGSLRIKLRSERGVNKPSLEDSTGAGQSGGAAPAPKPDSSHRPGGTKPEA
jgi:hypothetical protein